MAKLNTVINYLYRDASNYKMYNQVVLNGCLTPEQIREIFSCLYEGEYFIPSAVGLAEERFSEVTEDDHPWFELSTYAFDTTAYRPTTDITPDALVKSFRQCKENWEQLQYEAELRLYA